MRLEVSYGIPESASKPFKHILPHIFRARTVELGSPNEAVGLAVPSLACLARRGRRPWRRRMLIAQTSSASALCGRQWDGLKEGREERREARRRRLACFPLSLPSPSIPRSPRPPSLLLAACIRCAAARNAVRTRQQWERRRLREWRRAGAMTMACDANNGMSSRFGAVNATNGYPRA